MKLFVLTVLVALACGIEAGLPPPVVGTLHGSRTSRSATSDQDVPIVRSESVVKPDSFNYAYETGNGIYAESSGVLKKVDQSEAISQQGQYKYTSPEGQPISVSYVADENGYQPVGDHLPVPPPIPEAILRSLEYIKNHPAPVEQAYKKP